ncbi:glycoside hydrolase family 18 protein, partial [Conidiobolus coronatus NRRL 28638]
LDIYCEEETADIVVLSFLHVFNAGTNNPPEINLSYHCNTTFSEYPNLLSCPKIGQHIQKCQAKGKKVLLSLGGSAGSYGFKEEKHGGIFAKTLWNMFLGGESEYRPFGEAKLDGIDLDIEGGSSIGYTEMIKGLRSLFSKNEKSYLITGAPQCTFPDVYFGKVLDEAWFDYVFVQYYNNFCGVQNFNNPWAFNFAEWENWSETKAINPNVKVLLGVPGAPSAANLGYVDLKTLYPIVKNVSQTYKNFGGVMVWDVSQADGNQVGEHKFKFSEVVGSWLKSPGALGVPATKPTTTPAKPAEGYLDSEGRLDFKNLIETESIPDSGSECSKKVLACGETGYMVCYEGKWKAKSCPAGAKC